MKFIEQIKLTPRFPVLYFIKFKSNVINIEFALFEKSKHCCFETVVCCFVYSIDVVVVVGPRYMHCMASTA